MNVLNAEPGHPRLRSFLLGPSIGVAKNGPTQDKEGGLTGSDNGGSVRDAGTQSGTFHAGEPRLT